MSELRVECVHGQDAARCLEQVARLRMAVFCDWPYLYAGNVDYERAYLATYAASPGSVFVLAFAGDELIGASTGIPLEDEAAAFQAPFQRRAMAFKDVFYFGESVLLPAWRGRGLGHVFFDRREAHALQLGRFRFTAFASVERAPDDPRAPIGHRSHDAFWSKRGYVREPALRMQLDWDEVGVGNISHALTFWLRPLPAAASASP